MSDSTRLSSRYGVNPSITVCAFCGREKNEIALLGLIGDDEQAPKSCIINYVPCDKCQEDWCQGVALIAVTENPVPGAPPFSSTEDKELYLAGKVVVIKEEAASSIFSREFSKGDRLLIDADALDNLLGGELDDK